jgi:hypothetical protein
MKHRFPPGARTTIAAAVLVLAAPNAVLAGGKAEPLRIEFKRGAYGAAISESVRGVFKLLGEGSDTLELLEDAKLSYSGVLPRTGDYFITVKRSATAKGTSRFRLAVTVR